MSDDINVKVQIDTSKSQKSADSLKEKMKQLTDQMERLRMEGKETTEEYKKMAQEAANLKDISGDVAAEINALADDNFKLSAAMQGLSAGVAVFSGLQSATALLGVEDENLLAVMQKVQAAQALLNSVNTIAVAINKDKALAQAVDIVKTKLLTTATEQQTVAQKALNAAKLGAIGIAVALVAAIGTLIYKYASAKSEVAKFNSELNKQASESVAPLIVKVDDLSDRWSELGGNLEEKKKFIEENKTAFNELGVEVNSVEEAENLLIQNKEAFIEAMTLKAKAAAAQAKLQEEYKTQLEDQLEYERVFVDKQTTFWEELGTKFNPYVNEETFQKLHEEEVKRQNAQIDKIKEKAEEYNKAAEAKLQEANITAQAEEERKKKEAEAEEAAKKAEEARQNAIAKAQKLLENYNNFVEDRSKNALSTIRSINAETYEGTLKNFELDKKAIEDNYQTQLEYAQKRFGLESDQYKRLIELKDAELKEVDRLQQKYIDKYNADQEEQAKADEQKAIESAQRTEDAKLKTQLAKLEENSQEYYAKKIEIDKNAEANELSELQRKYDEQLIPLEEYLAQKDLIEAEHANTRVVIQDEANKQIAEKQKALDDQLIAEEKAKWEAVQGIVSNFGTFVNEAMNAELEAVKGNQEEEKKIRKKYAKAQFLTQIGSIAISTAKAIMETWSAYGEIPFVGPALAAAQTALIAGIGIAQTVKAKNEMNNALKMQRGGILVGKSHANGGIKTDGGYELEGGEAVINKRSTSMFAPILSAINTYGGGAPLISSAPSAYGAQAQATAVSDETIQKIVSATVNGIISIPVVVSENNITESQRTVGITRERSFL